MTPSPGDRIERHRLGDTKCRRCGECCTALVLVTIHPYEADKLGREFCYSCGDQHPGWWGIRKVKRSWSDGKEVCVFLDRDDTGKAICRARDERPTLCSEWSCASSLLWALKMNYLATAGTDEMKKAEQLMVVEQSKADARMSRAKGDYAARSPYELGNDCIAEHEACLDKEVS